MVRIFRRGDHTKGTSEMIASRQPVGKFRVERVLKVASRETLIGEVLEGIIYPGYKLKGPSVGVVRAIEKDRKKADFAVAGDRVALIMETSTKAEKGQILEVYQS
ncbi:tRNA-binding protein Pbp11 [Thermococcus stetteri]|uniref:tRNA-binding protein Pbp11 n=1 Tax=Thermococcus stetteri TaxID=49900 RepID=UPI001AE6E267|nr:tRNA-binding protein Pbp11 [Thermococcus stetteri]MBP1911809.1 translation initiation factor IF-2 [Thermococcus stetteri]